MRVVELPDRDLTPEAVGFSPDGRLLAAWERGGSVFVIDTETGTARAMALIFTVVGVIGLLVTLAALRSRPYHRLSERYLAAPAEAGEDDKVAAAA